MNDPNAPFWRRKSLAEMTEAEWESLCDRCGRCCLVKLEDEDTAATYFTDVGCRLLDGQTCRCTDYPHRTQKVSDCVRLTPRNINRIVWLPPTCGYRLVADGKYAEAIASLRAAAGGDSTDERARIAKADALVATRQYEAAHAVLTDTVRRHPASGPAFWRLAMSVFWSSEMPLAPSATSFVRSTTRRKPRSRSCGS